jgi:hypothetical protein
MDQNDRAATAVVLVVNLDWGAVLGADGDRSHCLSPFLGLPLGAGSNMRMGRPGRRKLRRPGRSAKFSYAANHSRPGSRVVTSWTIHRLPSGSLKEQKDP